jgi:hypothetical protein
MRIGSDGFSRTDWMSVDSQRPASAEAAGEGDSPSAGTPGSTIAKASRGNSSSQVAARECRTCAERKYKDVSNDSSVSFQAPTSVAPGQEAAAVAAHEQEHVAHNAARADQAGMVATSTVAIHTAVCPECGRSYVSGGTTTTTYSRKASAVSAESSRGSLLDAVA